MNLTAKSSVEDTKLADDLLRGARQISHFIFGEAKHGSKIYYLARNSRLPVFRMGGMLCARRSILMAWIASQEGARQRS
jgi:hypothetical protein